jgi:hypothetical protein
LNKETDDPAYRKRYRVYFNVTQPDYRLRVNDQDANFPNNSGNLYYTLYKATYTPTPGPTPPIPPLPGPWASACYEKYPQPTSLFKMVNIPSFDISFGSLGTVTIPGFAVPLPALDDWLEYLSWKLRSYLAWCPQHTKAIEDLNNNLLSSREPMATINELGDFYKELVQRWRALSKTKNGGGESVLGGGVTGSEGGETPVGEPLSAPADSLSWLVSGLNKDESPWFGGQLDLSAHLVAKEFPNTTVCQSTYKPFFGDQASEGVCKFLVSLSMSPIFQTLVLIIDCVLVLTMVLKYIPNWIMRVWRLIMGNKSTVTKVINSL